MSDVAHSVASTITCTNLSHPVALEFAKRVIGLGKCALPDVYTQGIYLLKQGIFFRKKR